MLENSVKCFLFFTKDLVRFLSSEVSEDFKDSFV